MSILLGGVYLAQYTVPGVLAGTTVTLTVTAPDGTTTTPAVALDIPCTAKVPASLVGSYLLVWSAAGTVVDVQQDQFTVEKPSLDLVSLSDLRDELNIAPVDRTKDVKLRRWLKAATAVVEKICGPILPAPRTEYHDGGGSFLVLPFRWVQSIQDVHETWGATNFTLTEQPLGQASTPYGYTWDKTINRIVRRTYGGGLAFFPPGIDVVSITYTVGMATIPDDIQLATTALVKHFYRKNELPNRAAFSAQPADDTGMTMVGNYYVPNEVIELIEPWRATPGIF